MPFDIGIGVLLGLFFSPFEDSTTLSVIVGTLFVLLPDLDGLIYYASKFTGIGGVHKKIVDHRDLLHYPIPYLLSGALLIAATNSSLLLLFLAGGLVHFLHDSIGTGWGIPWLLPFSQKRFKFLYQYDLHRAGQPQKLIWIWSKTEQDRLNKEFGDRDWYKHTFQIWKYAPVWHIAEVLVLLMAVAVLFTM